VELSVRLAILRLRAQDNSSEAEAYRAAIDKQRRYLTNVH
jgi:hypothetical protein